jgi:hypothetical protein
MYDWHDGLDWPTTGLGRALMWAGMKALLFGGFLLIAGISFAYAQSRPQGNGTLNQAIQARLLVKSDSTTYQFTRGLFIGDATACNVAILFEKDTAPVTFTNVQSGALLPFSVTKLMSSGTSCTAVYGLW